MTIADAIKAFDRIKLNTREEKIAGLILREIRSRLRFLDTVGLGYITLDRPSATLSGGEGQRIRLATQIGSQLRGVLYVLDEPSIGLHPRDNRRLLDTLTALRDLGNTVLVVEHDEETIRRADYVVDLGPGAGTHGGAVVAIGSPDAVAKNTSTALYGNISAIAESPKREGLLYIGSDDGLVQVTRDGGRNWQRATIPALKPLDTISMIETSPFNPAAAYVVMTRPPLRRLAVQATRWWLGASVPVYLLVETRRAWQASAPS